MTDETTTEKTVNTVKENFTWLMMLGRVLSVMEKLLPAFLMAWNNSLQQKNRVLEGKLELAKIKEDMNEMETKTNSKDTIRKFLNSDSPPSSDS